jgi:hypothetical protein
VKFCIGNTPWYIYYHTGDLRLTSLDYWNFLCEGGQSLNSKLQVFGASRGLVLLFRHTHTHKIYVCLIHLHENRLPLNRSESSCSCREAPPTEYQREMWNHKTNEVGLSSGNCFQARSERSQTNHEVLTESVFLHRSVTLSEFEYTLQGQSLRWVYTSRTVFTLRIRFKDSFYVENTLQGQFLRWVYTSRTVFTLSTHFKDSFYVENTLQGQFLRWLYTSRTVFTLKKQMSS